MTVSVVIPISILIIFLSMEPDFSDSMVLEKTVINYISNLIFGLILIIAQTVNNNLVWPSLVQNLPVIIFHATIRKNP
jgi:hypothetical protein